MQELSNIKPVNDNKENTIYLPENTTVSIDDVITKKLYSKHYRFDEKEK